MSRKQLLKNLKQSKDERTEEKKDNYFIFITTLAILLIVFLLSYFGLGIFYTKEIDLKKETKEEKQEINIDNKVIMAGQIFDQAKDEYYVLVYDTTDKVSSISTYKSMYESKDNALEIFTVDSSKKFNSRYLTDKDSNKNPNSVEDLKIVSPTLIKINGKKVSEYIEGEENIVNKFKE